MRSLILRNKNPYLKVKAKTHRKLQEIIENWQIFVTKKLSYKDDAKKSINSASKTSDLQDLNLTKDYKMPAMAKMYKN